MRRHNFQNLSWFYDLHRRRSLDLDPPYQRRSVWNQSFKDYFVDTILLSFPSPAVFLFEEISSDGRSMYHVVDGKQRLTTLFEFVEDYFPVGEKSTRGQLRGKYFGQLDDEIKRGVWAYQFLVEYVPSSDESIIDAIFDRLNRNVAKLTPQELRHARYDGAFINSAESLAIQMIDALPRNFPRLTTQSRNQMKDVELVSLLLLYLEEGARGYSQADLDRAFADRDEEWPQKENSERVFVMTINYISSIAGSKYGEDFVRSRFRNQADFYSLFASLAGIGRVGNWKDADQAAQLLIEFATNVDDEKLRAQNVEYSSYFEAARSASNDKGPRETRIQIISKLLGN